jgi:hypothetical protein
VRYLAIAALAATFWLSVVTLRLIIHAASHATALCGQAAVVTPTPWPPAFIELMPAPPPAPDGCGIEGWPDVRRDGWLTFRDARCGVSAAKPRMRACQRQFPDESFHARMDVLVARSGRVLSAKLRARPDGSSLAGCIEAAMKDVTYPRSTARYAFIVMWQGIE